MSSDPDAPDIKEVYTPEKAPDTEKEPTHYNLIPVENTRNPVGMHDIQRSISRQETTLSNIMNLIGDPEVQDSFTYDVTDMDFNDFTAA